MRPVDPRLLARVAPARRYVAVVAALGVVLALLVILQALVLARVLAPVLAPAPLDDADGLGVVGAVVPLEVRELRVGLVWLAAVVALRAVAVWAQERVAYRAGVAAVADLRSQLVAHAETLGPRWVAAGRGAEVAAVATRGLESLLPYFVRYLPTLVTAATVTPLALVLVLGLDTASGVIVAVTLPLVPLFMVLIGLLTQSASARHLEAMGRLTARVLDLVAGLPTLRGLGRSRGPAAQVRALGDAHRRATLGSLRVAFLSGMVLELLTTLSVALVAVTIGFRLAAGGVGIETALAVLVLAPEVYLPLRNVGAHFHASADGLAAAAEAFALLDEAAPPTADAPAPDLGAYPPALRDVSVPTPDGRRLAPVGLTVQPARGRVTALVGPNGDGKSTALMVLAGLLPPGAGAVISGRAPLAAEGAFAVRPAEWTAQVAWVPQRPDLGPAGRVLSLGQRQLRALDRAFASGRAVLLLDEPTAHLDAARRADVAIRIRAAAAAGAAVVVATHDDALIAVADKVVTVAAQEVPQ